MHRRRSDWEPTIKFNPTRGNIIKAGESALIQVDLDNDTKGVSDMNDSDAAVSPGNLKTRQAWQYVVVDKDRGPFSAE